MVKIAANWSIFFCLSFQRLIQSRMLQWSWNRSELRYSPNMTRREKTAVIHSPAKYPPIHFREKQ